MTDKLIITPKTKVGELLNTYPELEQKLIEIAPEFKKLKNPVLRRTIARVTSLQQAARVGGISVNEIVNTLRREVGQSELEVQESDRQADDVPAWLDKSKIVESFDAREMIAKGGHPLEKVLSETHKMNAGEIYLLITSFVPAPMIDKLKDKGFDTYTDEQEGVFRNYFIKQR